MDIARNKTTKNIVEAEELSLMLNVDPFEFQCAENGCGVSLTACSYKPENKNRPYFKKSNNNSEHSGECEFLIRSKHLNAARRESIKINNIFPLSYPSKLDIEDPKPNGDDIQGGDEIKGKPTTRPASSGIVGSGVKESKNRVVTTLKQIVRQYLDFPHDRDLKLQLPFIGETTYTYAFKQVSYKHSHLKYKGYKIYYGKFLSTQPIVSSEDVIRIKLLECEEWTKIEITNKKGEEIVKNVQTNPYVVEVLISTWSQYCKTRFTNKVEYIKIEESENYQTNEERCYLFFLAKAPLINDPFVFHVDNPKLIEPVFCEIIRP